MKPEAIEPDLLDRNKTKVPSGASLCFARQLGEAGKQPGNIPWGDDKLDIFSPFPGTRDVINHFDCESSSELKIAVSSVRTADGALDRSASSPG